MSIVAEGLSVTRPTVTLRLRCKVCGERFSATRRSAKFCSDACRMRSYRKRRRSSVHFRSERHDWETPQWVFDELDAEFHFDLDVWSKLEPQAVAPTLASPCSAKRTELSFNQTAITGLYLKKKPGKLLEFSPSLSRRLPRNLCRILKTPLTQPPKVLSLFPARRRRNLTTIRGSRSRPKNGQRSSTRLLKIRCEKLPPKRLALNAQTN